MPNILDLSARLSADVRPFVNSMASGANASHSTFQNIAQAATMYLGARGLLGTLNRANQASMEFGQSLADASAISTLSVKEIGDALMSLDNVFGRVTKASQSMYRILSSGFSQLNANQLVEFQKAVGVSAKVIRADLYNTADVMTTIANAYQLNIKEIEKLQDWFYITVREGKAQGQDLARTLGLVINSASEAGVSLNELGAAIAVLSRTQSVSQSMIGLNQMLNAFIKPTLQAQAAARKWGIELSATSLKEKGLTATLTELNQKVGGNVEALEKMFGNIRAGRAILSLTGKQFKNYLNVVSMYDTGAGAGMEAFEKQIDTVQNAYERLQAQQEKTLIQIGDDWSGVRKIIYNTGEVLLKAFSDLTPVSRWSIYLAGIRYAANNIIAVVNNLKASVDGVTGSVNKLSKSFAKASANAKGLHMGVYGPYADAKDSYNKIYRALFTLTGIGTGRNKLDVMAERFLHGSLANSPIDSRNTASAIGRVMFNPKNPEHQAMVRRMAEERILKDYVKWNPIYKNGKLVDYTLASAATGNELRGWGGMAMKQVPFNYAVSQEMARIYKQSIQQANAMRLEVAKARGDLIAGQAGVKGAKNLSNLLVQSFYTRPKGERINTLSTLTSRERLIRLKEHQGVFKDMSTLGGMNQAFRYGGFGYGMSNLSAQLGSSIGKAFSAVATASMAVSLIELAYRFGKRAAEAMGLADAIARPTVERANADRRNAASKMFEIQVKKAAKTIEEYEKTTGKVSSFTLEQLAILKKQFTELSLTDSLEGMEAAVTSLTEKITALRNAINRPEADLKGNIVKLFAESGTLDTDSINNIMDYVSKVFMNATAGVIEDNIARLEGVGGTTDLFGIGKRRVEAQRKQVSALREGDRSALDLAESNALLELQNALEGLTMDEFKNIVTQIYSDIKSGAYKFGTDYDTGVNNVKFSANLMRVFKYVKIPENMYAEFALGADERRIKAALIEAEGMMGKEYMDRLNSFSAQLNSKVKDVTIDALASTQPLDENDNQIATLMSNITYRTSKANELRSQYNDFRAEIQKQAEDRQQRIIEVAEQSGRPIAEITSDLDLAMGQTMSEISQNMEKIEHKYHTEMSGIATSVEKFAKLRGAELQDTLLGTNVEDYKRIVENIISDTNIDMGKMGLNKNQIQDVQDIIYEMVHQTIFNLLKQQVSNEVKLLDEEFNRGGMTDTAYATKYGEIATKYIGLANKYSQAIPMGAGTNYAGFVNTLQSKRSKFIRKGELSALRAELAGLNYEGSDINAKSDVGLIALINNLTDKIATIDRQLATEVSGTTEHTRLTNQKAGYNKQLTNARQQLANYYDNFERQDTTNLDKEILEARLVLGEITYNEFSDKMVELYIGLIDDLQKRLSNEMLDEASKNKIRAKMTLLRAEVTKIQSEKFMHDLSETTSDALSNIELKQALGRLTDRQALRAQSKVYKNEEKALREELRNVLKSGRGGSEYAKDLKRRIKEAMKKRLEATKEMLDAVNEARNGLLSVANTIISSNMQGDRLSNYGLYHATNLLARLAPGLNIQQQGVSLSQVLANANARYSGSTPDTSRAMQQQQRLSTIMDSYIAAKQYQDAGIGKNVQTIVTIMGKRTPLFLN